VLSAKDLGKRYGSRWLFRRLDLCVEAGQCLAISGKNGGGKSTLIKSLIGLISPSEGTVERPQHRNDIGYYSIEGALYPNLTVIEHLELAAELRGLPSKGEGLLETVDLLSAKDKLASQISTGMKTRLKLALAIQPNPKVLFLDEPSASLDEFGRAIVAEIIRLQCQSGAVLIASNDPSERSYATHVLSLDA